MLEKINKMIESLKLIQKNHYQRKIYDSYIICNIFRKLSMFKYMLQPFLIYSSNIFDVHILVHNN